MEKLNYSLSVIVCTYNRAFLIHYLLDSLAAQEKCIFDYEVIIVDNNSKDHTESLVKSYCSKYANWYYIFEKIQGLSTARNKGCKKSIGDYIIYMDDECILPENYLQTASRIIQYYSPDFFGGPLYPYYHFKKPVWMKDAYFGHNIMTKKGYLTDSFLSGGNLGIKKKVLYELGGFNPAFGVKGNKPGIGEDTLIQIEAKKLYSDIRIFFEPDLWSYHKEPIYKFQLSYSIRKSLMAGKQRRELTYFVDPDSWILRKGIVISFKKATRLIIQVCILIYKLSIIFFRNRSIYPYWQNYYYEEIKNEIYRFGFYFASAIK